MEPPCTVSDAVVFHHAINKGGVRALLGRRRPSPTHPLAEATAADEEFQAQVEALLERSLHDSGPASPSPSCQQQPPSILRNRGVRIGRSIKECNHGIEIERCIKEEMKEDSPSTSRSTLSHFQPASIIVETPLA